MGTRWRTALRAPLVGFPRTQRTGHARTWPRKFSDAFRGLRRAVRSQTSFAVHLTAAGAVVAAGAFFRVQPVEWCLLVLSIGLVFIAEIFNTAIESLARGPGRRRHPRLRDALDMAGGAVLAAAITAAIVGVCVFGRRILDWL